MICLLWVVDPKPHKVCLMYKVAVSIQSTFPNHGSEKDCLSDVQWVITSSYIGGKRMKAVTMLSGTGWGNCGRHCSPKDCAVNGSSISEASPCQDWSELEGCWDSLKALRQSFSLSYLWILWVFNGWRGGGFQLSIFSCSKEECFYIKDHSSRNTKNCYNIWVVLGYWQCSFPFAKLF